MFAICTSGLHMWLHVLWVWEVKLLMKFLRSIQRQGRESWTEKSRQNRDTDTLVLTTTIVSWESISQEQDTYDDMIAGPNESHRHIYDIYIVIKPEEQYPDTDMSPCKHVHHDSLQYRQDQHLPAKILIFWSKKRTTAIHC